MTTNLPALISLSDMERMAKAMAQSQLFGVNTPEAALSLMLVAQAEGLHPATAMMEFHVINKRPSRKSWAMQARFQAAGGSIKWLERSDERVRATFSHPLGGTVTVDWDMVRAKTANLMGNPTWKSYPRQMLTARVISEGVRTVFPGATGGFYSPEEVAEFGPDKARDITPPKPKAKAEPEKQVSLGYDPETGELIQDAPTPAKSTGVDWLDWSRLAKAEIELATTVEALDDWCDANADTLSALTLAKRTWGEKLERIISDKRDALRSAMA